MKNEVVICFDMDGTIADLYGVDGWLDYLRAGDVYPYEVAEPLGSLAMLRQALTHVNNKGYHVCVISWGAMNGTNEYTRRVKAAKVAWCKRYFGSLIQEYHVVKYGTPKHWVCKYERAILVDDNKDVRDAWSKGRTIDATNTVQMVRELMEL